MSSIIFSTSLTILSCLLLLSSSACAFNITKLLNRYDGFGTFNSLLSQTRLADAINRRRTITVFAVQDGQVSELASKSLVFAKRILMNHVILDYYDMQKLKHLKRKTALLTTLYQTTGDAVGNNGHVNVTDFANGEVRMGSGVRGSQLDVTLNKLVAAQPYNISVLEVSGLIITPGTEDIHTAPAASPRKMLPPSPAPAPAPHKKKHKSPPAYSPDMEDTDEDESTSDGPVADGPGDDKAPSPAKSGAGKGSEASLGLVATVVTTFLATQLAL